jgi:hypothetical protein
MATIKIQRTSEYINLLRNYRLFIDGQKIGTIANGKTKEFEITAGRHSIVGKIDWCSSPELTFDINDNDTKTLLIGGFKNSNWIMPITIGVIVLCFGLSYALDSDYILLLIIPTFLIMSYYLTIGRKNYLSLTEL